MSNLTVYRQSVESVVSSKMADRDFASTLADCHARLRAGYYNGEIVAAIVQKYMPLDMYDAYCFMSIWAWLCAGKVNMLTIGPIGEPWGDSATAENAVALLNLPMPFTATYAGGGNHRNDGCLQWGSPLLTPFGRLEPDTYALEVGYTAAENTFMHIKQGGGLARWPYGSEYIHLFIPTGEL